MGRIQGEQQAGSGQHDEPRVIQIWEITLQIYVRGLAAHVSIAVSVLVQMHTRPTLCATQYPNTFRLSSLFSLRLCLLHAVTL